MTFFCLEILAFLQNRFPKNLRTRTTELNYDVFSSEFYLDETDLYHILIFKPLIIDHDHISELS